MSHLDHLKTFLEAYRTGSFSKASERVGITQPAASMHIQALESYVGKKLFIRKARGVEPTAAADELARAVGPMLDGLEGQLESHRLGGALAGTVHLAGPSEFISARLGARLAPLLRENINVRLHLGNKDRIYGHLAAGTADLAVTASVPDERVYDFAHLLTERYLMVCAPETARQLGRRPTAEQLGACPLIAYDEDLPLVRSVWSNLFRSAPSIQAALTAADMRMIRDVVISGTGWSVLPDYLCAEALEGKLLVEIQQPAPAPVNHLYLVWNKAASRNPRTVYVRDFITRLF